MQFIITNSMRCTFLDCNFRFFLEYILRLTPVKEAVYFVWGRLVHTCSERIEHGEEIEDIVHNLREEAQETITGEDAVQLDEMLIVIKYVMDAHLLKWHEQDQYYEDLNIENKFELPLPCGFCFQGKIDKMARDIRDGSILNWERKTAATTGTEYYDALYLASQPKGYILAAQRYLGLDSHSVLYDVYKKPQLRQRQTESREAFTKRLGEAYLLEMDKYFERRILTFTQQEIDEYFWDIDQVAETIQWHLQEGIWNKHHPGNRKGGCAYAPICLRGDYSGFYERDESMLNPELHL